MNKSQIYLNNPTSQKVEESKLDEKNKIYHSEIILEFACIKYEKN